MTGALPSPGYLEIVRLSDATLDGLSVMLKAVEQAGETDWFKPHPFSRAHLATLADQNRHDLYYVIRNGENVLGYGLLRGWEEGYDVPSLGIVVHPDFRGSGLGTFLMQFLHMSAHLRGSRKVRLRVSENNNAARALYTKIGYHFDPAPVDGLLTAYKDLGR